MLLDKKIHFFLLNFKTTRAIYEITFSISANKKKKITLKI